MMEDIIYLCVRDGRVFNPDKKNWRGSFESVEISEVSEAEFQAWNLKNPEIHERPKPILKKKNI